MIPHKAVVKSPTVPFRHQTSGEDMVALNLRTKPLIAVPTGVARSEDNLNSMVIPGIVRKDGVIVDENKREYVKVAKVLQTQNSEIHLVQINDSVQSQVFVGKQVPHPPAVLATPRSLGAKRPVRPKNIVPPGPFNNPDLENEVRTTLSDMSLEGDKSRPSPFATHAVVVTDDFSLVLLPVGHADGLDVLTSIYNAKRKAQDDNDVEALAQLKQLTINVALQMGRQVWRELAGYHGKDLAHRDLKLENIFVTEHGVASIGDQGLTALRIALTANLAPTKRPRGT